MSKVKKEIKVKGDEIRIGDLIDEGEVIFAAVDLDGDAVAILKYSDGNVCDEWFFKGHTYDIVREVEKPDEVEIRSIYGNPIRVWDAPGVVSLGPRNNTFSVDPRELIDAIKTVKGLD